MTESTVGEQKIVGNSKTTGNIPTIEQTKQDTQHAKDELDEQLGDIYRQLSVPIPEEYLLPYEEDGKKFTGFKAQYAINLLNGVVGLGCWDVDIEFKQEQIINKNWLVIAEAFITLRLAPQGDILVRVGGYGGGYFKHAENAYKASKTASFKNACRYLGIGNELYLTGFDEDIVYEKVDKEEITEEPANISDNVKSLMDKINSSTTVAQVNSLKSTIEKQEGKAVKDLLIKAFNEKLIKLNKE
jgi:hypothetical protein